MKDKTNDIITSALVGITAYMCADIVHEVVGHGGIALISENHIDLLTSVFFRSSPGSIITDLAGPLSNLLFGFLFFTTLRLKSNQSSLSSLVLITIMGYNLFWFSGTIIQSGFSETGDWTYAVAQLNIGTLTKPLLVVIGVITYLISLKLVANMFSDLEFRFSKITLKQSIFYAYFFGAFAAIVAGLFFVPDRIAASREGLMEMVASSPILFINRKTIENNKRVADKINWIFLFLVCVVYILFCLTLGKGI